MLSRFFLDRPVFAWVIACGFRAKWGTDSDGKWGAVTTQVGRGFDGKWGTLGLRS
jgi:hypothetical protein